MNPIPTELIKQTSIDEQPGMSSSSSSSSSTSTTITKTKAKVGVQVNFSRPVFCKNCTDLEDIAKIGFNEANSDDEWNCWDKVDITVGSCAECGDNTLYVLEPKKGFCSRADCDFNYCACDPDSSSKCTCYKAQTSLFVDWDTCLVACSEECKKHFEDEFSIAPSDWDSVYFSYSCAYRRFK